MIFQTAQLQASSPTCTCSAVGRVSAVESGNAKNAIALALAIRRVRALPRVGPNSINTQHVPGSCQQRLFSEYMQSTLYNYIMHVVCLNVWMYMYVACTCI